MWLALRGDRTTQKIDLYGFSVLKKKLETINSVGEVRLVWRRDCTIRVNVLQERRLPTSITATDLIDAFKCKDV